MIEPPRPLFRILGPLEVWNGRDWSQISAPKWRSLLASLLLRPGQPVSSGHLIAEVWGDDPPARAPNLVSGYVLRLRRLLGDNGDRLVTRAPGYQIVLHPDDLDAERFARLAADGRRVLAGGEAERAAALLTQALDCWRSAALADVPPSPLVTAEADRLEEARLAAVAVRAEAELACGRHAPLVPELRRLLADHPLREELWALLVRALSGAGRQAEALETYARAREVIADELGVDPGAELQRLYQEILNADSTITGSSRAAPATGPVAAAAAPPPPAPSPAQLPADIPDFTGRSGQVEAVCQVLSGADAEGSPGAVPVVLVAGAGGLGKTALAVHAAHQLAGRFPDGQLYASLHGVTHPADPAEVLARFLRDLGMDGTHIPVGDEERAACYRTRLAGRRVLIVLDDARDAAQVGPLLPGSATCAVLITARGRLPELPGAKVIDLAVLSLAEARSLFSRVADERRASAQPAATEEVLAACAGLPLAIRIAGARLAARGGWSVRTLAGRLSDERHRLDELRAGNLAVRASFEVSFASLPGPSRPGGVDPARAFRMLGVWTGPFLSLSAASALLGQPPEEVAEALEVLVDAHLLDSPEPDIYRFHDLLRVYAADRVRAQETEHARRAASERLLTWYLHTAEAAAKIISPQHARVPLGPPLPQVRPLSFASLDDALAWCEEERAGLVAATRLAAEWGLHELGWKLPAAAMSFFYRRSHWADWVTTHEIGLASARQSGNRRAEAWMLNNLGMAYGVQHREESVTCFQQALELCREIDDSPGRTRAANNVANANIELGRFAQALVAAEQSLPVQRRAGNRYGEGIALGILGRACCELGRFADAVEHLGQALVIVRDLGDQGTEADSLADLGEAYLGLNRVSEAVGCLRDSLTIRRHIGDRFGQAVTLRRLGQAHQLSGEAGEARLSFSKAIDLFSEIGDQSEAVRTHAIMAKIAEETD
ncbi:MAG TPA: BTAD domain-containing putative transcriptional regulator [Streptosporangiaceae bacterium]